MAKQQNRAWMVYTQKKEKGKADASSSPFMRQLKALFRRAMRGSIPDAFKAKDFPAVREAFRDVFIDPALLDSIRTTNEIP